MKSLSLIAGAVLAFTCSIQLFAQSQSRMLAVSPMNRGRGIGRKLAQECIDRALRDGAKAIGLTTGEMMRVAEPMYERMGFKKEAELGTRFGVKHARYVLILKEAV